MARYFFLPVVRDPRLALGRMDCVPALPSGIRFLEPLAGAARRLGDFRAELFAARVLRGFAGFFVANGASTAPMTAPVAAAAASVIVFAMSPNIERFAMEWPPVVVERPRGR